ncbi:MAG: sulfotransferase domain-containing protein [Candidatus Omnitrophica bacterium]|nr:sulfotransferase domain-containing protein [Candidatus Omnitrophota bacterium]
MPELLSNKWNSDPPAGGIAPERPILSREVALAQTVVLVDGITRTGKSLLGPVLSSLERVEIERMEEIIEYIGGLHRMGKLQTDAAVALLRMEIDMHLYNSRIGRNTNFRWSDHSSIWRYPRPGRYLLRLFLPEGEPVVKGVEKERPIHQTQTHDQLANFPLFHQAFGKELRVVEMVRHPVDLVDSWMRRGWGTRFGEDPRALTLCIRYREQDLPFYALGWEETYLASSPLGRVIRMIQGLWEENWAVYQRLPEEQKQQVFWIPLEPFAQDPMPTIGRMARFLGTRITRGTRKALRREGCPRSSPIQERRQRQEKIETEATMEEKGILRRLIDSYESLGRTVEALT